MSEALKLMLFETQRVLVIARGGRLQPWLGPALRGLAGGRLKAQVCRQPVRLQLNQWRYCRGCPLQRRCAYGETIEGGQPEKADPARPIVIDALYPCPEQGRVGDRIPVRVCFIGASAAAHAEAFWDALRRGGADPGLGLGEDRVLFDLAPGQEPDQHYTFELPDPEIRTDWLAAVRVVLTSPLILHSRSNGRRYLIEQPTLADLLARWQNLAELLAPDRFELAQQRITRVVELAQQARIQDGSVETVKQERISHRSGERWEEAGVIGWLKFGPVAGGLLPWLEAAGRIHIGTHRSSGAGGWRVVVESTNAPSGRNRRWVASSRWDSEPIPRRR